MKKLLIRLRLKNSSIVFDNRLAPGILAVKEITLEEEPESLDDVLQQVKIKLLHNLFEVEYLKGEQYGPEETTQPLQYIQ
jgi:predicted ATPase